MGKPWRLTFALLLAIAILGGLTSATPAAVIGWSLLYGVFDICGYKKGDGYPIMIDHRHRVRRAARHVARPVQIPAARGHQRL